MKAEKSTRMWVARDKDGMLFLYESKPKKNKPSDTFWSSDDLMMRLDCELFPNVKWEDKEPTRVVIRCV